MAAQVNGNTPGKEVEFNEFYTEVRVKVHLIVKQIYFTQTSLLSSVAPSSKPKSQPITQIKKDQLSLGLRKLEITNYLGLPK